MNRSACSTRIRVIFTLLVALIGLCGCAYQYLMKLSNGDQILSSSRPKLQGASYYYTDGTGAKYVIAKSRVVKIRPVSVVKAEEKPASPPPPAKPKQPRHWYYLWLA
jgi:hypothetical protein